MNLIILPCLAVTAMLLVWAVFNSAAIETGGKISTKVFTLGGSRVVASSEQGQRDSGLAPGQYELRFDASLSPARGSIYLLTDKNVRRPSSEDGTFEQTSLGYIWRIHRDQQKVQARFETVGVARVSVHSITEAQAEAILLGPAKISSLFAGGLAMMCVYSAIVAVFARQKIFGYFAYWLWTTLALGSVTAGYDLIWFGADPDPSREQTIKQMICALWASSAILLFLSVFHKSIKWRALKFALRTCYSLALVFCLAAPLVSSSIFMPAFWLTNSVSLVIITLGLAHVWGQSGSRISAFYSAGWLLQVLAVGYELAAAMNLAEKLVTPTLVPAGALSAFFIGIAVAEALRIEREARMKALAEAQAARNQLSRLFASSPAGLISFDANGDIVAANPRAKELLGWKPQTTFTLRDLLGAAIVTNDAGSQIEQREGLQQTEMSLKVRQGNDLRHLSMQVIRTESTTEIAITDQTAAENLARVLKTQATTDSLTSLRNRRALSVDLKTCLNSPSTAAESILVLMDVSRFSAINSYFGQAAGDSVLREVGNRLSNVPADFPVSLYRLAADTFVGLLRTDLESARQFVASAHSAITSLPITFGRRTILLEATCVGQPLSTYPNADSALSSAKYLLSEMRREGQTAKVHSEDDPFLVRWREEQNFVTLLRTDNWTHCIEMQAQPLISLQGDKRQRFEMLMRIKFGERRLPPGSFLRAAESIGAMPEIDLFVVASALEWIETMPVAPYYVTANLSGASLSDPQFVSRLHNLLRKHRSSAKHLCLEITESVAVSDLSRAEAFIRQVGALGVLVALDDFGQGYTNFNYLSQLPVRILKLDGSVVRDILKSPKHQSIVQCLSDLSHGLGMVCVAEWVEDSATADLLSAMGVDVAQGWHFARAMPLEHWFTHSPPTYQDRIINDIDQNTVITENSDNSESAIS